MTAICQANGKTWSITSGAPRINKALLPTARRFFIARLCHVYLCIRFCFPLALLFYLRRPFFTRNVFHCQKHIYAHLQDTFKDLKSHFNIFIRPEICLVELFRFHHLITSYSEQPLTIQYGLNEEPIKCILWNSSRLPGN